MTKPLVDVSRDFPILNRTINGHRLVWLDSAATSQKPTAVLKAVERYYEESNANVLRSVHTLASEATEEFNAARAKVAGFIGANRPEEVIFTRGTTEGLNLVARGFGDQVVHGGDEIVLSPMEHHSNLIPWQQLARRQGATLRYIQLAPDGTISLEALEQAITPKTRIVALSRISNVLGTINPIREAADLVHRHGGYLIVDGAQSVPHEPTRVEELGADFLAFSGHKMCAPTGIGALWGKHALLDQMEPVIFGGEMISYVDREEATWAEIPAKFEGGTPNIAGAIGLGAAVDYLNQVGMEAIFEHSRSLGEKAFQVLQGIDGVSVYGPASPHAGAVAFNIDGIHPHDVAQVFDAQGVAIRAGHHCAQPLMQWLGVGSTARASFYLYNGDEDIERLKEAILETKRYFRR
ncbi:cysteine desulfurase [Sulfobacillus harzensis]|uniref:cysteine desulfurase n=1 Tax=Sulfobacillus harzensis TaxID=2729629 RepID=A0A7Y0L0Q6_9FIRM|nr:cysteine desulfurase [Sulfobacillus harzensis]NMP21179.1 cysteine desulfurase [Sulfobacillus harzensis]